LTPKTHILIMVETRSTAKQSRPHYEFGGP